MNEAVFSSVQSLAWPISRLGEAVEILVHKAGFSSSLPKFPPPPTIWNSLIIRC